MQYLTYDEYAAYGGDLSETAFPAAELRARKQIDKLTASRAAAMKWRLSEREMAVVRTLGRE